MKTLLALAISLVFSGVYAFATPVIAYTDRAQWLQMAQASGPVPSETFDGDGFHVPGLQVNGGDIVGGNLVGLAGDSISFVPLMGSPVFGVGFDIDVPTGSLDVSMLAGSTTYTGTIAGFGFAGFFIPDTYGPISSVTLSGADFSLSRYYQDPAAVVPEPAAVSLLLLGSALVTVSVRRRRLVV